MALRFARLLAYSTQPAQLAVPTGLGLRCDNADSDWTRSIGSLPRAVISKPGYHYDTIMTF